MAIQKAESFFSIAKALGFTSALGSKFTFAKYLEFDSMWIEQGVHIGSAVIIGVSVYTINYHLGAWFKELKERRKNKEE
jgi:hypothetical protein